MTIIAALLALFGYKLFFSINSILGVDYSSSSESYALILYFIIIDLIVFTVYSKKVFKKGFNISEIGILFFYFFTVLMLLFTIIQFGFLSFGMINTFLDFLARVTPAILMGIVIARNRGEGKLIKWLEVVMLVVAVSSISGSLINYTSQMSFAKINFGGSDRSELGYSAGIGMVYYTFCLSLDRKYAPGSCFTFIGTKIYKAIQFGIILALAFPLLYSGTRGAFFCTAFSIMILLLYVRRVNYKVLFKTLSILISGIVIGTILISVGNEIFLENFSRIFEFISSGRLDWEKTSGREQIYEFTLSMISDSILWGYGIGAFNYYRFGYPHNFFMEILFEGGLLYLVLWLYIIIKMILLLWKQQDKAEHIIFFDIFLITLLSYNLMLLMVSSSYLRNEFLWFTIAYIFTRPQKARKAEISL